MYELTVGCEGTKFMNIKKVAPQNAAEIVRLHADSHHKISATVTPCHDPDVRSWPEYVAERLAAQYPDHEVSVETGMRDYAEVGGYPIGDFDEIVESWWDDLCRDPYHAQWSDGDSVEARS